MPSTIYGSIIYKGKSYPFFLEGRKVNIVGKAWEYFEVFQDAGAEETISGITSDNRQIMFLRCRFNHSFFQQNIWFAPVGYILSRGNVDDLHEFTFEKISFYSEALNSFYPPREAMKADFNLHNWDGKMTIELRPFEETAILFDYKECKCQLNMSRYVSDQFSKSDIGSIHSVFSFEFNSAQPYIELLQYWLALFDFLSFVNYGTDIIFDKITLSSRCEDGLFDYCADVHIFSDKEYQERPALNAITVKDIPLDKIGTIFTKIAALRGHDKRLAYYFPKNYREGVQVDENRWLLRAMTFEGLFRELYPYFKQNQKESFRIAKNAALDALNVVDQSRMRKKEREYFNDCKEEISHYEGLLMEMLDFIVTEYKDALADILSFNLRKYNMNPDDYGTIYSKYRNKIAHGDIEPIGEKEIAVYVVLQAAIYFMLLEGTGLDSKTLRVIAKKLFL